MFHRSTGSTGRQRISAVVLALALMLTLALPAAAAPARPDPHLSDLGDLPDPTYPTRLTNNGPSHQLGQSSLLLGQCVDGEADGQPNGTATGDDGAVGDPVLGNQQCTDDEDGVTPNGHWQSGVGGGSVNVTVAGGPGCLSGWIDWNHNGNLTDAGDNILNNVLLNTGTSTQPFTVPANPVSGTFYARFRLYSPDQGGVCTSAKAPTGPAINGEVEDYVWQFVNAVTLSGMSASSAASPLALPLGLVTVLGVLLAGIVLARHPV